MKLRSWRWSWTIGAVLAVSLPSCGSKIPLPDSDGDGLPDLIDPCPQDPDPTCQPTPPPPEAYDCANPPALSGLVKVPGALKDRYIVVAKPSTGVRSLAAARGFAARFNVDEVQPLALVQGFAAKIAAAELAKVLADLGVAYVQQEGVKSIPKPKAGAAALDWGLDRIDAREGLDGKYTPLLSGIGVDVYISDTGVSRIPDFGDRLSSEYHDSFGGNGSDKHGHGTHVAGSACGTTWGVAKACTLYSVRVLNEQGSASDSQVIAGMEWIAARPGSGVVNASWGGGPVPALDAAVCRVIESGKTFVAAAGNESEDSRNSTPARIVQVVTVGAMDRSDRGASFTNYGPGVDLFAPGVDIESDTPSGGTAVYSGTSMAAPHAAGAAALYFEAHRDATPAEVEARLIAEATPDTLTGIGEGSPNRLLFVRPVGE